MSEDDDWFERALRDADDESDDSADSGPDHDGSTGDESAVQFDDSTDPFDDGSDPFGGIPDSDGSGGENGSGLGGIPDSDGSGGEKRSGLGGIADDGSSDDAIADDAIAGDGRTDDATADDGSSEMAANAQSSAEQPDPFGGEGAANADLSGGSTAETDDPFGGVREETDGSTEKDDPFGGVRPDDAGEDPFAEDFEAAMGGQPGTGEEFDEAEFDSDIERIDIGIEGLDEMILGGVPLRSLITVIGSAGTGKTTFGLQFLQQSLSQGGQCVYITLEETEESILSSAEEKGWPFGEHVERGNLVVVSMDPIEMANSLDSIRGDLTRLITQFGADRLVLDSVSLLEMMYDDPATRRSEVFDFARSLKQSGVTTLLTSEASGDNAFQSRHGLVEYLVDAVFVLRYVRPSDFQETRLAVEIQKIRDANHSRETKPYDITDDGIDVYRQANLF